MQYSNLSRENHIVGFVVVTLTQINTKAKRKERNGNTITLRLKKRTTNSEMNNFMVRVNHRYYMRTNRTTPEKANFFKNRYYMGFCLFIYATLQRSSKTICAILVCTIHIAAFHCSYCTVL